MKIIHILSSDSYSGAENVVCQIIEMFRDEADIDMIYCSPDGNIRETLKEKNIKFEPLARMSVGEIKKTIKKIKPAIIHAHDYRASTMCAMSGTNIPIISHIHNNPPWIKRYGLQALLFGHCCRRFKCILTVSEAIMNEFVFGKKYIYKTSVIGNPVNVKKIREMANADEPTEKIYDISFLGRLSEPKNPLMFVEIISEVRKKVKDIKAVMIGDGELRQQVENMIEELGLNDVIEMTGFQENPYVYLNKSKILCMPSKWEGYGLAAVEALALGVPVVCSGVGGLHDTVDDKNGFICKNITEFINCTVLLLNDSCVYKRKKNGALNTLFSFEHKEYYCLLNTKYYSLFS